jgi:hypothetical protein
MELSFKKSFLFFLTALALVFSTFGVIPVYASSTALAMANALFEDQALITGASYATIANSAQTAVFTSALTGFPKGGDANFAVMSTGDTAAIPVPDSFANTDYAGGNIRGNSDYDVTILKIDFNVPAGKNCLTFQLRFLSEEYPNYVGSQYNDAFIAELDNSNWTTTDGVIAAPNNFATVSGANVSVNSLPMSAANGAGTAFDSAGFGTGGASTLGFLAAQSQLTPGHHSLYLSIFDQSDRILDSAVFLDDLIINNSSSCTRGILSNKQPLFLPLILR